MEVKGR